MKATLLVLVSTLCLLALPCITPAEPLKSYVSEFTVAGSPGKDELKTTLQGILASRLNPARVQLVESRDKAEVLISGSYALFGKVFSVDVLIRHVASGKISKVFEQGDGQDDLLPAMGRLARKIDLELAAAAPAAATASAPKTPVAPGPQPEGRMVTSGAGAPLEGAFTSIAPGRTLPSGERELFVAGDRLIRLYHAGAGLKLIAETVIPLPGTILAIDTADLDHDGVPELYVTIWDRETLSSRVYRPADTALELLAGNLPWFFRGIGNDLKQRAIFVQEMGSSGEYYGGVAELVKTGEHFTAKNSRTLPGHGNIYTSTPFRDASGLELTAVLNDVGILVVSSPDGREIWRSSDKYGGSEMHFKHESLPHLRATGDEFRRTFIDQRLIVLPNGTMLVPHNEGSFNFGRNRSYDKYTLHVLQWTGFRFTETWHSSQMQGYLADYAYDPATDELILLEVTQKPGLFAKGRTVITTTRLNGNMPPK